MNYDLAIKNPVFGTGEMVRQLRAMAKLLEDPGSIPSTPMADHNCL